MRLDIIITVLLAVPTALFSDMLHVPGDYSTIQEAIDAAVNGDTVLVQAGTYVENIDFLGKAVTVKSSDGPELTAVDGAQLSSVVVFQTQEGRDSVLEGFTILNGKAERGGGIHCFEASPTLQQNIITDNTATAFGGGGGIYGRDSSLLITNNLIAFNQDTYFAGGGILLESWYMNPKPTVSCNTIVGNSAEEYGGGIYTSSTTMITGNVISNNYAPQGGGIMSDVNWSTIADNLIEGNQNGGIEFHAGHPYVVGNMIRGNTGGGGIRYYCTCNPTITGNIFEGNDAAQGGGISAGCYNYPSLISNNVFIRNTAKQGGGIYLADRESTIINNTFTKNSAHEDGGALYCESQDATQNICNTILWGNEAPRGPEIYLVSGWPSIVWSNVKGGWPGSGNIDSDPLFVDAGIGDVHIPFTSPCRDAGTDSISGLPDQDFEGDPRFVYWTVDIGADEFHTHLYCTGDATPGGAIKGKLVGLPDSTPVGLFIGSGVLDPPMPSIWGAFYLEQPWILFGPLGTMPANGIMVLPATVPPSSTPPYDVPMQALIGSKLTNLFILPVR